MNISELPPEMMDKIFAYLTFRERLQMRPMPDSTDVTTKNPISLLKKLDKLNVLHITRIDLTGIDWTTCEGSNVNYIHLKRCSIDGTGAEKLVRTFKHL
ncbi:uncharacterized protein LOC109422264 isoform X7 [Aedes albopictus]|uniref:F-box domain-containing protein n=1 Tax=Aedes albopictus TaxID=7160 RepID=A0ABM1Z0W3_AEDAL